MDIFNRKSIRPESKRKQERAYSEDDVQTKESASDKIGVGKSQTKYIQGKGLFLVTKFNNEVYYIKWQKNIDNA